MNSWTMVYLGGPLGTYTPCQGNFTSMEECLQAIVNTAAPWNWAPMNVFGPQPSPPGTSLEPQPLQSGAWLAIAQMIGPNGGPVFIGYGTFSSQQAVSNWAGTGTPNAGFVVGYVS